MPPHADVTQTRIDLHRGARGDAAALRVLTKLDDRLIESVQRGDIRFVRAAWVLQPAVKQIRNRQELEELERGGASPSPLMSTNEAVAMIRRGDRSAGALTYGWLSPFHPDPAGKRLEVVRAALSANLHIEGFFWDFASLYQNPHGGRRTDAENEAFKRALDVMADVYASAVGTTVLQMKEIPPRPREFDGALCLYGLKPGVQEASIRDVLGRFGEIASCELDKSPAVVRFTTHDAALAAKRGASAWTAQLCEGVDTLYNERSYDGRHGDDDGRDDDDGRGWCAAHMANSRPSVAPIS